MYMQPIRQQVQALLETNEAAAHFGLALTPADAQMLLQKREDALQDSARVEFGGGILPKLAYHFCDSPYIHPAEYAATLAELQESFYALKTEAGERLDDDTLLRAMKTAFDTVCGGSAAHTCELLARGLCRPLRTGDEINLPFKL